MHPQYHNTGGKLSTGVIDTGGKFAAGFNDSSRHIFPWIFYLDRGNPSELPTLRISIYRYPICQNKNMENFYLKNSKLR